WSFARGLGRQFRRAGALALVRALKALPVEVLGDEVPVDDVRQDAGRKARPLIAIVDVISVLPHIEREQWDHAFVNDGRVGVVKRSHAQAPAVEDEPGPAIGEVVDRLLLELLDKRVCIPEAVFDQLGELAVGLLAPRWRKALPEEAMIPQLRAVVEQLLVAGALGVPHHLKQRSTVEIALALD